MMKLKGQTLKKNQPSIAKVMTGGQEPLVSVIIPSYNGARYITEAIDSVLAQMYKNVEIIIVDDGSTDDTRNVLERYGDKIKYMYKKNGGPGSARNTGINHAQGEYIAFLDTDDVWMDDKLEKQVAIMQSHPEVGLISCNAYRVDSNDEIIDMMSYHNYASKRKFLKELSKRNIVGGGSSALIKRECFDKVGLFHSRLRGAEDWEMWLKIAMEYDVFFIEEPLLKIYVRSNSLSAPSNFYEMFGNELKHLDLIFEKYKHRFTEWDKLKSYSYRYYVAAAILKDMGELEQARMYIRKAFVTLPLLFVQIKPLKALLVLLVVSYFKKIDYPKELRS